MFTYGGMPKKQVTVSNSSFIFKVIHDIRSCFSIFFLFLWLLTIVQVVRLTKKSHVPKISPC